MRCVLLLLVAAAAVVSHVQAQYITDGCGSTKGCLTRPDGCTSVDTCTEVLTWVPSADKASMAIQMQSKDQWVAFALSDDDKMGSDSVVECKAEGSSVTVGRSFNTGKNNGELSPYSEGISGQTGSFVDGVLTCSFTVTVKPPAGSNADQIFDMDKEYFIFLGQGPVTGGQKGFHSPIPVVTAEKVAMASSVAGVGAGAGKNIALVQAHGILMISAWTLFIHVSVLLARHYKDAWPGTLLCDKKPVWFSVHRVLNITVMLMTVAAFILIFIYVGGWTSPTDNNHIAHPIMGVIVTALVIINPIMSAFRCDPGHERRFIFNIAHSLVGFVAQVLAAATIFLGMLLFTSQSVTPDYTRWVLVATWVWNLLITLVLEVHRCMAKKKDADRKQEMEMQQPGSDDKPAAEPYGLKFKYIVFAVYVTVYVALYLTMIVSIAIGNTGS